MKKLPLVLLFVPLVCFAQTNEVNELLESGIQKVFDDKFDEALRDFNLALEKDKKGSIKYKIYFERAQLKRIEFKDFNGALKDYTSSIKFNPNYARAYMYRGILYERNLKNLVAAERDYRESIKVDPKCGVCFFTLGDLYELPPNERIKHLEKAAELKLDPAFNGNLIPCVFCYSSISKIKNLYNEDYIGAIEELQKIIDINQEFDINGDGKIDQTGSYEDALYDQAYIYFLGLNNNKKALKIINKVIETSSNHPEYYSLRAKIKYKNEDISGALKDHQTAKKTEPKIYDTDILHYEYYYPYIDFDKESEKFDLPININTSIEVRDIKDLETSNNQFFMSVNYKIYSPQEPSFINLKKDTLTFFDFKKNKSIKPLYVGSDRLKITDLKYVGYDNIDTTNEVIYTGKIETDFFHFWDLKEYPFDTQKLQFKIEASIDTSFVRLNQSNFYKSTFQNVKLKDGYKIEKIEFEEQFNEQTNDEIFFPGVVRHPVYPDANYSIVISRSGGWLFVKLFLGSFLAFVISWIVFLIPNKEFDSRISLTVGGIFGAIGNRYFVDSTIPAVQVLTKADMINNMIFALLILNVLIVIVQRNDKINFGLLEQNKFAMIFTGTAFVILNTLIVLW